jgi:uncharacterized protein with HEPN domain
MSRKRRDREYLADLAEAVQSIVVYTGELTYEEFLADRKTQDAVLRNLPVMGEAVKKLSAPVKKMGRTCPGNKWPGCMTKWCTTISASTMILSGRWPRKNSQYCCPL